MHFELTTRTIVASTDTKFNLDVIFEHFECDNEFLSVKYKDKLKTSDSIIENQSSFLNQITFKFSNSTINIKIFKNSKIQLTGVKSIKDAKTIINSLLKKLSDIRGEEKSSLVKKDNLILDTNNNIYDESGYKIVGKKTGDKYVIFGKNEVCVSDDEYHGFYVNQKYKKCIKNIYFYDGSVIGKQEIIFPNKKYYLKKGSYKIDENNNIIKYGEIVASIQIEYIKSKEEIGEMKKEWEKYNAEIVYFKACEGNIDYNKIKYEIKMSNYTIDVKSVLDRDAVYHKIRSEGYSVSYDSFCYKGINLKLFFNKDSVSGICKCDGKCSCEKLSMLIFRTGKIILSSSLNKFLTEEDMKKYITKFINDNIKN